MLSLARIGRGREDYHLRAVGADASTYYSERGEVAGLWLGGGSEALSLEGRVEDRALLAVLAGYEPGARAQSAGWVGQRLVAPPRTGTRTPGFDACWKAPKSVSALWAFGDRVPVGDRTLDRLVESAHDEAVREAMSYLEASAARGRRGYNGLVQVESSGFVAASFRQRTSRANDPHLHTHVLIANMCRGDDGRWGALDARLIYAHAKAAGYLYESHLRHRLSSELGLDWTAVENGIADVAGVPDEMIEQFSKRSREIRERLDEVTERINEERESLGLAPVQADSAEALDIAARETRAAKLQHVATSELRVGWRVEAAAAGLDPDQLAGVLHRASTTPPAAPDADLHRRVTAHADRACIHVRPAGCGAGHGGRRPAGAPGGRGAGAELCAAGVAGRDPGGRRGAPSGRHPPRRRGGGSGADGRAALVDARDAGRGADGGQRPSAPA